MTECIECSYFIKYPNGKTTCLMKHDYCIIKDFTVYPKDCTDFKEGVRDEREAMENNR